MYTNVTAVLSIWSFIAKLAQIWATMVIPTVVHKDDEFPRS